MAERLIGAVFYGGRLGLLSYWEADAQDGIVLRREDGTEHRHEGRSGHIGGYGPWCDRAAVLYSRAHVVLTEEAKTALSRQVELFA